MEALIAYLGNWTDDPGTLRMIIIGLATLTVFVFGLGVSYVILAASDPIRRRVRAISVPDGEITKGRRLVNVHTLFGPIAQYVVPREEIARSKTTSRLVHANFRDPNALQTFYAAKAILTIFLPVIVLVASRWFPNATTNTVMMYSLVAAYAGFIAPSYFVDHHFKKRQRALRNAFPDALDLLVVCVEAGLGLTQAIQRVSEELGVSHPELSAELGLVNAEIGVGVDSVDALKNFAERTGLQDIRGLVSLLVQTLRFGTGVADALRVYAEEFRDKRMQLAEEKAAKMGTKMIFPLVFFMFPGFFVVAVGPAVITLIDAFSHL